MRGGKCQNFVHAVEAYNRIAPIYPELAEQRRAYLDAIEQLIIAHIPHGSRSLLDVGAGDGSRSRRIAGSCGISEPLLLEPAKAMQGSGTFRTMRAEDLDQLDERFDVILCLWNVLGHLFPKAGRIEALQQFRRLLTARGKVFIDVSHRYNARHYGAGATAARFLRDQLIWREENGDVAVTWNVNGGSCTITGHVFTDCEMRAMCREAGLNIEKRFVVDYATGKERRWQFEGHLLYMLSRSFEQTSTI